MFTDQYIMYSLVDNNIAQFSTYYALCNYSRPNGVFDNTLYENIVSRLLLL